MKRSVKNFACKGATKLRLTNHLQGNNLFFNIYVRRIFVVFLPLSFKVSTFFSVSGNVKAEIKHLEQVGF